MGHGLKQPRLEPITSAVSLSVPLASIAMTSSGSLNKLPARRVKENHTGSPRPVVNENILCAINLVDLLKSDFLAN
jgi:hypothetical protein